MKLQIQDGAPLHTADGARVGKITGIVVDPLTHDVLQVVVSGSRLSTRKIVVSLSAIRMASEELATLDRGIDPADFPLLEQVAPSDEADEPVRDRPDAYTLPSQLSPPTVWLSPEHKRRPEEVTLGADRLITRNLPDRAVIVGAGTSVIATGHHRVGSVAGVLATNLGQTTHLVVDADSAAKTLALPAQWIEHVAAKEVRLQVTAQLVTSAESPTAASAESPDD